MHSECAFGKVEGQSRCTRPARCSTFNFTDQPDAARHWGGCLPSGACVRIVMAEWLGYRHSFTLSTLLFGEQHDVQLDYYGRRLATCSSDRQIKVCSCWSGPVSVLSASNVDLTSSLACVATSDLRRVSGPDTAPIECPIPGARRASVAGGMGAPQVWQPSGFLLL